MNNYDNYITKVSMEAKYEWFPAHVARACPKSPILDLQ